MLVVNTNEVGAIAQMVPAPEGSPLPYVRGGSLGAYGRFWDSQQLPCQAPPWGRLNAIDLRTGKIAWQVPLGNVPVLEAQGITGTGSLNLGGPIVTAGGLVFIGGATDSRIRAFDLEDGTGSLARGPASQRARGPGRLSWREEWASVRGDCRRRRRQVLTDYFGCRRRLCAALAGGLSPSSAPPDRGSCDAMASGRRRGWPSRGWAS